MTRICFHAGFRASFCLGLFLFSVSSTTAAPRTWIGGNVDWVDGGATANWTPADEPDADDEAIFNTANSVSLGSNNSIQALTMSGGIDLFINNFDLTVDGLVSVGGASTNLNIGGATGSIDADDVVINASGTVELRGGTLVMDEEAGTALIDLNAGGTFQGHGDVVFKDTPALATLMLVNDGTITALSRGLTILSPPPIGTLHLTDAGVNGRLDLDGSSETGVVNVNRNQTFFTEMQLLDTFNGSLNLFHNSTFRFNPQFTLGAGGTITVDNGFIDGGLFADTPADVAFFDSAQLTQSGGTINVVDTDGTLQIDANFTMSGGTFTNFGTVIFNGVTNITAPSGYAPSSLNAHTIVNSNVTINHPGSNFNWDGNGSSDTTINGTALLSITANQIDTPAGDNTFGGTITLNDDADLTVNNTLGEWQMAGSLIKNSAGVSTIDGARLVLTGFGQVNAGTLDVNAQSVYTGSASLVVASGATATLATTRIDVGATFTSDGTLNIGPLTITGTPDPIGGTGVLRFSSTSLIEANTTINTATFDWDGSGIGSSHTINPGVTFTINSGVFDGDGDMDDPFTLAGNGSQLIVNNTNGLTQWTAIRTITANAAGAGMATIGGTSRMILSGGSAVLNVDGNTTISAPVTFGADSTTAIDLTRTLRLTGGNTTDNVNRIEGGVINGPGILAADGGKALHGFGTINSNIDFDGASNLFADDGTLTINGTIVDVNRIGTDDVDGVLNVVNPWNTNVAGFVTLAGGTIQGGTITIDGVNGVSGFGTIASRVINNQGIRSSGGTLVLQTAANDNDWDGAANDASLHAQANTTLELRDNATFGFAGSVSMFPGGKVFTNGFALDFNPGSSLFMNSDALFESTSSTDLGGVVTTSAGPASTIKVANNFFLTFEPTSATTLVANLRLENNNINIEAGATFSGGGALVIPDGSHLVADNLANIGTLLQMDGAFRPGNFDGIGRVDLFDYQQGNTGELFVELTGTGLNAFDRLVASGDVSLDGYLNLDIDGGFVPALGNTFNIITGNSVVGTFDTVDVSGLPANLAFHVNYLSNAVQVQIVNKPFFSADFDEDGDVDSTDLAIWQGAVDLNQLGDADGDNDSDGHDFLHWQRQVGSAPLSASIANVPEPSGICYCLTVGIGICLGVRFSRAL